MRSYDEYKESNIAWLGEIPAHWDITRGKNLYRKMNRPVNDGDEVITCFRNGEVTLRKNRRTTGFTESLKEIGYQGIKKGDLVIHVMDAFAGAIGVSDSDGKGTPVYSVCQAKGEANNYYYAYVLREMARTGYIQSLYRGIRERSSDFRFEVFANQYYPVPPLSEQERIAKFLDYKISRIEKLISLRERQIIDLEDLKKALINRAVTQGGWKVGKAKRFVKITNGTRPLTEGNIPVYGSGKKPFATCGEYKRGPAVLLGRKGSISNPVYVEGLYWNVDTAFDVKPLRDDFSIKFYYYLATCFDYGFYMTQTAIPSMTQTDYYNMYIPVPPIEEQIKISEYLDKKCSLIDRALINFSKQIEALNELKARLISDCVTGRINILGQEN